MKTIDKLNNYSERFFKVESLDIHDGYFTCNYSLSQLIIGDDSELYYSIIECLDCILDLKKGEKITLTLRDLPTTKSLIIITRIDD